MVWIIRVVVGIAVLLGLALAVSFVVAPPKNFGGGLAASSVNAPGAPRGGMALPARSADGESSGIANPQNVVPLGVTIVHSPVGEAQRSYTTRGRIEKLPGEKAGYLMIHHAAIADFLNREGKVVGMDEMVMEFPAVVPGMTLDGLMVGDPVEFTFEVRWNDDPVWVVVKLVELAPEAELGLKAK